MPTQEDFDYKLRYNARVMAHKWYVIVNDLIGGHAIGLLDKPMSEYNFPVDCLAVVVADFMTRETASQVVSVMNAHRGLGVDDEANL